MLNNVLRARSSALVRQELIARPGVDWMVIYRNLVKAEQLFKDAEKSREKPEWRAPRHSGEVNHIWIDFKP